MSKNNNNYNEVSTGSGEYIDYFKKSKKPKDPKDPKYPESDVNSEKELLQQNRRSSYNNLIEQINEKNRNEYVMEYEANLLEYLKKKYPDVQKNFYEIPESQYFDTSKNKKNKKSYLQNPDNIVNKFYQNLTKR